MIRFGTNFILTMAILPYFVFGSIKPNYIIMNMDDVSKITFFRIFYKLDGDVATVDYKQVQRP